MLVFDATSFPARLLATSARVPLLCGRTGAGAFEVYLLTHPCLGHRVPRFVGLHSKLWSRRWPNVAVMMTHCMQMLYPLFGDETLRRILAGTSHGTSHGESSMDHGTALYALERFPPSPHPRDLWPVLQAVFGLDERPHIERRGRRGPGNDPSRTHV